MHKRKYLIDIPLKWFGKFKILNSEKVRIHETFINTEDKNSKYDRLRCYSKFKDGCSTIFYSIAKKDKIEEPVAQSQYNSLWIQKINDSHRIHKCRYYFDFYAQSFSLDVFEDNLIGLAFLGIYKKTSITMPPYLKVVQEITDDEAYTGFNLSTSNIINNPVQLFRLKFPRRAD